MQCNLRVLFQSRIFLFLFTLILLLLSINHYYSQFDSLNNFIGYKQENLFVFKILQINDREPTYKLATYQGYTFPLERNRAQTELLNSLKLKEICKTNRNRTIIDIGASLGEFGFYGAACGCQVYMFEIDPKKVFFIEKSIHLNSFESRVFLIKKAVSDLISNKRIYFSQNTSGQLFETNNINLKNNLDIFSGETVSLNNYPFPPSLTFDILRVDVQGHELHVFKATERLFREHRVNHVIFEYTPWGTQTPVQRDLFQYMTTILAAKKFYALHPKQPIIYGPLTDGDLTDFYAHHKLQNLQRDVYALFQGEVPNITANPYSFPTSF